MQNTSRQENKTRQYSDDSYSNEEVIVHHSRSTWDSFELLLSRANTHNETVRKALSEESPRAAESKSTRICVILPVSPTGCELCSADFPSGHINPSHQHHNHRAVLKKPQHIQRFIHSGLRWNISALSFKSSVNFRTYCCGFCGVMPKLPALKGHTTLCKHPSRVFAFENSALLN